MDIAESVEVMSIYSPGAYIDGDKIVLGTYSVDGEDLGEVTLHTDSAILTIGSFVYMKLPEWDNLPELYRTKVANQMGRIELTRKEWYKLKRKLRW